MYLCLNVMSFLIKLNLRPVNYSDNENMFNIMEVVNLWDNLESLKVQIKLLLLKRR